MDKYAASFVGKEVFIFANYFYQGKLVDITPEYYVIDNAVQVIRVSNSDTDWSFEPAISAGKWERFCEIGGRQLIERSSVESICDFTNQKEKMTRK